MRGCKTDLSYFKNKMLRMFNRQSLSYKHSLMNSHKNAEQGNKPKLEFATLQVQNLAEHAAYRDAAETSLIERTEELKQLRSKLLSRIGDAETRNFFANELDKMRSKTGETTQALNAARLNHHTLTETVKALRKALAEATETSTGKDAAAKTARRLAIAEEEAATLRHRLKATQRYSEESSRIAWMDGPTEDSRRRHMISHS
mmetsp:Transcript_163/g.210  ORF Transcript_163/g.210 Transcript_163/m.210 type:complete len:202 (-) Transcript_163:12-617(-)